MKQSTIPDHINMLTEQHLKQSSVLLHLLKVQRSEAQGGKLSSIRDGVEVLEEAVTRQQEQIQELLNRLG